ncbi:MAG: hypothetical protein ACOYM3_23655 [Terrimicrobiaceae bacterium]
MTGILIATYDRQEALARWTAARIRLLWPGHPPVFFSGLTRRGEGNLGFEGDSRDWMNVNLQAVRQLIGRGFQRAYLILDDHPPVGSCYADYLNDRLPELSGNLHAACIGLLGYGQHRRREGHILGPAEDFLEHSLPAYRWKFSLHPGLWTLEDLQTLLECRMKTYPHGQRTPWNFERHRDVPGDPRVDSIAGRCFRIRGASCLAPDAGARATLFFESGLRLLADTELFAAKLAGGKAARDSAELRRLWMFGHYLGPYPIFWSGCMRQGKPHRDFEKWLARFGSRELRASWKAAKAESFPK